MSSKPNAEGYFVFLLSCRYVSRACLCIRPSPLTKRPHVFGQKATVDTAAPSAAVCLIMDTIRFLTEGRLLQNSLEHNFPKSATIKPLSLMQHIGSFLKLCACVQVLTRPIPL